MTPEAWYDDIASLLAFTDVTFKELETVHSADALEVGRDEIEFMRKCLCTELKELTARGWSGNSMEKGWDASGWTAKTKADWISLNVIREVKNRLWMPEDKEHLKYLLFRANIYGFIGKFHQEIQARIHAVEAAEAVSSILRRQG